MEPMEFVIHWAGFIGAWLLVAGPLLQGAIELRDEEMDREGFEAVKGKVEYPAPISRWWWLLPPVYYVLNKRRSDAFRRATMGVLSIEQRRQFVGFTNKATGWFTVAGGAFLIFLKEAWELSELYELPVWIYIVVVIALAIAAIANTIGRLHTSEEIIHMDDPDYGKNLRAQRQTQRAQYNEQKKQLKQSSKATPAGDA